MAQGSDSNDASYKSPSPGSRPVSVPFFPLLFTFLSNLAVVFLKEYKYKFQHLSLICLSVLNEHFVATESPVFGGSFFHSFSGCFTCTHGLEAWLASSVGFFELHNISLAQAVGILVFCNTPNCEWFKSCQEDTFLWLSSFLPSSVHAFGGHSDSVGSVWWLSSYINRQTKKVVISLMYNWISILRWISYCDTKKTER